MDYREINLPIERYKPSRVATSFKLNAYDTESVTIYFDYESKDQERRVYLDLTRDEATNLIKTLTKGIEEYDRKNRT